MNASWKAGETFSLRAPAFILWLFQATFGQCAQI